MEVKKIHIVIVGVFFILAESLSCKLYAQVIAINSGRFQVDIVNHLIVCNQLPAVDQGTHANILLDTLYTFSQPVSECRLAQRYQVFRNGIEYSLYFTKFPLISINTETVPIRKDSVTAGSWTISDTLGNWANSPIGINIRGAYSSTFPKKSYKVDFYTDQTLSEKKDTTLFGMRTDSEWLLLALYNESARINNVVSHSLWLKLHKLYYQSLEPDALSGIRTRYVDVFVNGTYMGVYALTESIDRKQLKLKKTRDNGQARGELYKTYDWTVGTLFQGVPNDPETLESWGGFELKYPDDVLFWSNLRGLIEFGANASDSDFRNQINSRFKLSNIIDYFLFLNLTRATDNTGKNIYIARYKENEPYFLIAWDLDGTWGYIWTGERQNIATDILSNGLFNRLLSLNPDKYRGRMKKRWFDLRASTFSARNLKGLQNEVANTLRHDGAYLREATRWPVGSIDEDLAYMSGWLNRRLTFLDNYFSKFPDECTNPSPPTITASHTAMTSGSSVTLTANGCSGTTIWNTDQTGSQLIVSPIAATTYWARCSLIDLPCESKSSPPVSISVIDAQASPDRADITLAGFADKRVVSINEATTIALYIVNKGPQIARRVQLKSKLPAGLLFMTSSSDNMLHEDGVIEMQLDSILANQEVPVLLTVQAIVPGVYRSAAQISHAETVDPTSTPGSGTGDGEDDMVIIDFRTADGDSELMVSPNNNQRHIPDVRSNQPNPSATKADLSAQLITDKRVVREATPVSFTIIVKNEGGLTATDVQVNCSLPGNLMFLSGSGLSIAGNTVSVTGLSIPASGQVYIQFTARALEQGAAVCRMQIMAGSQSDPDSIPGNGYENGEDDEAVCDLLVVK
ncbi:putative repeat protein (TIGR01451 family) [Spirosoma lacussanchae]|uniref:CotH kinase family protein n=1 Tax=Spirosoma lacussanchae TaxID=1884249 RepID=UPI00110A05D1|nr:CotH kinase family protein [Spirosoma lacussanchae]